VGGKSLAAALTMIALGGMCVLLGVSSASETTFDAATFIRTGGASLYGFILFHELLHRPAAEGLARLVTMVTAGRLHPQIEQEAPFDQIAEVANKLYQPGYGGQGGAASLAGNTGHASERSSARWMSFGTEGGT
jgi:NADPH2:quinone reductase